MLGGQEAAQTIARLIVEQVVDGPGLADAVGAAAKLRVRLPPDTVLTLLRDAEPGIRADACCCALVPGGNSRFGQLARRSS